MAHGSFLYRIIAVCALGCATTQVASQQQADARGYFDTVDLDGDGRISLPEFRNHMSRGFRDRDRNGDHVLQGDELPAPGARAVRLEDYLVALAQQFKRQDRNDDGYLDPGEFIAPPR